MALSSIQEDAVECWGRRMTGSPTLQQHCDTESMGVCDRVLQGKLQWLTAAGQQSRPNITPRTVSLAQLIPSVRTRYRSALAGQLLGLHSHSLVSLCKHKSTITGRNPPDKPRQQKQLATKTVQAACIPPYLILRVQRQTLINSPRDYITSVGLDRGVHTGRAIRVFLKFLFDALVAVLTLLLVLLTASSCTTSLRSTAECVSQARLAAATAC